MIIDFYFLFYLVTILNFSDSFFKTPFPFTSNVQILNSQNFQNNRICLQLNTYKKNYHFSKR